MRVRLSEYFNQGQAAAKQKGIEGLKEWLENLDQSEAIPIFLIDEAGQDLLEREIPAYIIARLDRRREHAERLERKGPPHRQPIRLTDGSAYRMVPDFQSITLRRVLQRPKVIALPVAVAALVSALICLSLSRYLTFPLERLRRATQHIAAGDLTQRVAPSMGNRRDEIADLAGAFDRMAERLEKVFGAQRQLLSETEIERLNELIGQLLELSRLEAGVDVAYIEKVDMRELLEGLIDDAQFEAESRGCEVKLKNAFPASVKANTRLLHSAIENVVRNAIKYTKPDTAVKISMLADRGIPDSIIIQVRDHGPGVPEKMLPHLFEPFMRVEEARDSLSGGHGLGLAIADRAIRLYGGEIVAQNEPDGGLSILIRLELAAS